MGCYDRIIRNHAILNSRKYNIPDNVCKVHPIAHDKMKFRNRIGNKISDIIYTSTTELELYWAGQGTGDGGTLWTFISVPIMETVEQIVHECTIHLPNDHQTWEVKILGFVDDKKHYVNNILKQLKQTITEAMQQSIRVWDEVLTFVRGELEMSKCKFCILDWTFDISDTPTLSNKKETILSANNIKVHSQQLSPNDAIKYLEVVSQPNGNQEAITKHLRKEANLLSKTIALIYLPHYYAHIFHQYNVNPKLNYPLATMYDEKINSIQRRIHPEVIASKGYNRKWPRELRYGHHQYCGLGM